MGIVEATADNVADRDWADHWRSLVRARTGETVAHGTSEYWDRRAPSFARFTGRRADQFLEVVAPYLSPRKTLIDVGAGAGRHAVPLTERVEWVTAVEPSEGMRAQIPHRDNMTIVASAWDEAEVAAADLVICCHVLYGVSDPIPFIAKLERAARERVFVMLRENDAQHPATLLRAGPPAEGEGRQPRFSDLFLLLLQMGIAPDITFIRYPVVHRYADIEEAVDDCRTLVGDGWNEAKGRALLKKMLVRDGDELTFDSGIALSGIAHWQPLTS